MFKEQKQLYCLSFRSKKVILNELFNDESIKPGSQLSNWCLTCLTKFDIVTYVKQNNVLLCDFITLKVNSG